MSATINKPTREYADADFLFISHPVTKNLNAKKGANAVKQSILHLLLLKEGDKPFHPEIQSPIYKYMFENLSVAVKILLEGEVLRYLNYFEPRAEIRKVVVSFPNPNDIVCSVEGVIINIQSPFTVNVLVNRLR